MAPCASTLKPPKLSLSVGIASLRQRRTEPRQ